MRWIVLRGEAVAKHSEMSEAAGTGKRPSAWVPTQPKFSKAFGRLSSGALPENEIERIDFTEPTGILAFD